MDPKRQGHLTRSLTPPTPPSPPTFSTFPTAHDRLKSRSSNRSTSPCVAGTSLGNEQHTKSRKSRKDTTPERRRRRTSSSRSSPQTSSRGGRGKSRSNDRERNDNDRERTRAHKYSRRERSKSRSRGRSRSRERRRSRSRNKSRERHRYRDNRRHNRGTSYNSDHTDDINEITLQQQIAQQQAIIASQSNAFKNDGSFMEMFKKMQEQMQPPCKPTTSLLEEKPVAPPPLMVGKRRGGRILKTGMVAKQKTEQIVDQPKDAWSLYMAEVKKYREVCCQEEDNTRPLVK